MPAFQNVRKIYVDKLRTGYAIRRGALLERGSGKMGLSFGAVIISSASKPLQQRYHLKLGRLIMARV